MDKRERILQLMPIIEKIQDEKLKNGVIEVWVKAWEESAWPDLADCPFNVNCPNCNLIQHTNFVATIAMAMASLARNTLNISVDTDLLLAGSVLHDVSKVLENVPPEVAPDGKSKIAKNLVHGTYGVHLALNAGLPLEVAHLINVHTPQVSAMPKVIEGIFLCYADLAAYDMLFIGTNIPLNLERLKIH